MVLNCGCIDMAELNKTIHIRKGSTEQTVKLYTTPAEVGHTYSYIKVDGVQAYIPLGAENDSRATMGRVKEHTGHQFVILASGKPPYHMNSYTSPGTYTWTCPVGVTRVRLTIKGAQGEKKYAGVAGSYYDGGSGELKSNIYFDVTPNTSYNIVVGLWGTGKPSSFANVSAQGGSVGGGFRNGGKMENGYVIVEYGGDI